MLNAADLPDDVAALKAMLIAAQAREAGKDAQIVRKDERIERLEKLVATFKQTAFGRKWRPSVMGQACSPFCFVVVSGYHASVRGRRAGCHILGDTKVGLNAASSKP